MSITFDTTLLLGGKTATGIEVPDDVVEQLGGGKRPKVAVEINGHTYRSTVAVMGGKFMLPVAAQEREAAGIAAGDRVSVTLEIDAAPRVVEVPADLATALGHLRPAFDALSYSRRKEHVRSIEEAKTVETRQRRIAKTVESLGA
jgi:hypothetical protein